METKTIKIRKIKEEYKNKYNLGSWWFSSFDHQECANDIERIRKEIAKQIFEEIKDAQIDVSRLAPEEVHAAVQRSREYWFVLLDANKVDALKKKYEVD